MILNINNKKYNVKPLSKLSFQEFSKMMVEKEVFDLKEYISCFIEIPIADLMSAEIKTVSMPALHASLFDIDIESTIKKHPETLIFNGEYYITENITLVSFGQNYIFDLYFQQFKSKKINEYELYLYALACALSKDYSTTGAQKIYDELSELNWREVLPVAFFLAKKLLKTKGNSIRSYLIYTTGLKRMKRLSMYRMTNYNHIVKKFLPKFWLT